MASTRLNNTTVRLLSRKAASFAAGKEASLAPRCRNYASTSKTATVSVSSSGILIPSQSTPSMVARSLSSSAVSSAEASTSTSSSSPPSSQRQQASSPASATTIENPSPATQGILGGIAKIMGYDTRTSAAIRATSDYYDRCSERDEKEGTFWYDGTSSHYLLRD